MRFGTNCINEQRSGDLHLSGSIKPICRFFYKRAEDQMAKAQIFC